MGHTSNISLVRTEKREIADMVQHVLLVREAIISVLAKKAPKLPEAAKESVVSAVTNLYLRWYSGSEE